MALVFKLVSEGSTPCVLERLDDAVWGRESELGIVILENREAVSGPSVAATDFTRLRPGEPVGDPTGELGWEFEMIFIAEAASC